MFPLSGTNIKKILKNYPLRGIDRITIETRKGDGEIIFFGLHREIVFFFFFLLPLDKRTLLT